MMLSRAIRVKEPGFDFEGGVNLSTSAVPSQLLPAKTTGVVVDAFGALTAGAGDSATAPTADTASTASAGAATLRLIVRAVPLRLTAAYLPSHRVNRNQLWWVLRRLLPGPGVSLR